MFKFIINPLYWPIFCVLGVFSLLAHLPLRWQLAIGAVLGKGLWIGARQIKKVAAINLALAFPAMLKRERKVLLKKNCESLGMFVMELSMSLYASSRFLKKHVQLYHLDYLQEALKKGGVILVCPHFMCVELIGRMFSVEHDLAVVYRPQKIKFLNYLNRTKLMRFYKKAIPRDDVREMVRALRAGFPVFYTPDVDAGRRHSIFVPFFGTLAATLTATPKLARLGQASIVPCYFYRRDDCSGYDIHFEKALSNYPTGNEYLDVLRINQVLEEMILKKPEQYIWQYRRYKTRPEGEARFYR